MAPSSDVAMNSVVYSFEAVGSAARGQLGIAECVPIMKTGQHGVCTGGNAALSLA